MKRLLLNLLTALSLLLFVAAAVLWVRSHFASDALAWYPLSQSHKGFVSGEYRLDSRRGVLSVGAVRGQYDKAGVAATLHAARYVRKAQLRFANEGWIARPSDARPGGGFAGWTLKNSGPGYQSIGVGWSTPYWFLLLLFSLPPALHLVLSRRRRRRRRQLGLCPRCNYDLRATPGRCSECGWSDAPAGGKAEPA